MLSKFKIYFSIISKKSVTLLAFIFAIVGGYSQTVDSNYVDGVIYLKVYDTATVELAPYDNSIPELNVIMLNFGITSMVRPFKNPDPSIQKVYRVHFTDLNNVDSLVFKLNQLAFVEYAEKAPLYRVNHIPDDYNSSQQWNLDKVKATQAWDINKGSASVTVAILDNAVMMNQEDIAPNAWENPGEIAGNGIDDDLNGYTDDVNGFDVADGDPNPAPPAGIDNTSSFVHGTHCAGIAAASTNNGIGIASLSYQVKVIGVKCTPDNSDGKALTSTYEGLDYAITVGADIVSMSFGSDQQTFTWNILLNRAESDGILLIAAAGNEGSETVHYPAGYSFVLAVGATDQDDGKAGYSNYGDWVDLMAPGTGIRSTFPENGNTYGSLTGTSMACPLVASLAGLTLSTAPNLSLEELKSVILNGCDNIDSQNQDFVGKIGAGRMNALRSLSLLQPSNINSILDIEKSFQVYPNPSKGEFYMDPNFENETIERLLVLDHLGRIVHQQSIIKMNSKSSYFVQLNDLPSGFYILELMTLKSSYSTQLIIE